MRFWEDNRKFLTGLGIAFLCLLAGKYAIVNPVTRAAEQAGNELKNRARKLRNQRKGTYELDDAARAFKRSNAKLDAEIKALMERVEIPFHDWTEIPRAWENEPGAYFATKHAEQRDELFRVCQVGAKGEAVKLSDEELGFGAELKGPLDNKGAQENLNRLSIVRRVVELLAGAGVTEIVSISPGKPVKTGPPGYGAIMREYPVRINVKTRLDPLMKFLHNVRRPGDFFLVVRGLDVKAYDPYGKGAGRRHAVDDRTLTVAITAAGMRSLSVEERRATAGQRPERVRSVKVRWGKPRGH